MQKAVFVTGATVGTGLAIAKKFAADGYAVFITSRDGAKAQAVAEEIGKEFSVIAKGYGLGIRDEEAVKADKVCQGDSECFPSSVAGLIGVHPNDNTATVWMKTNDLVRLIEEHGNKVHIVSFE